MMSKDAKKKLKKGKIFLQQKDLIKAIKYFEEGLKLAPDSVELWFNLGSSFLSNHKFRDAIRCFHKAIKLNTVGYIVFKLLAESYIKIGKFDEARKYYEKFLEFDPDDKEGKENLQKLTVVQNIIKKNISPIYLKRINQKMEEALLLKSQKKYIDSVSLYKEIIQLLFNEILDSTETNKLLNEVRVNIDSNYFEIINGRIETVSALIKQQKFDEAIENYRATLEIVKNIFDLNKRLDVRNELKELLNQTKINKIKNIILKLGTQFGRLQVIEIVEECKEEEHLIVSTINQMIEKKEIYAKFFESSKSVAFDQQTNIDEIDKLMEQYRQWEKEGISKK